MVLTILASALGAALLILTATKGGSKEGFWSLPSRTWKVEKVLQNRPMVPGYDASGGHAMSVGPKRADFYQSPNFQAIVPPRFSNVNYGANIRARLPPYNMTGVPADPLNKSYQARGANGGPLVVPGKPARNFDLHPRLLKKPLSRPVGKPMSKPQPHHIREGYQEVAMGPAKVAQPDLPLHQPMSVPMSRPGYQTMAQQDDHAAGVGQNVNVANYANGNYHEVAQSFKNAYSHGSLEPGSMLEVDQITQLSADGELTNPVVYDRYIFSNRTSRLRSQGDPIRGDIPVIPLQSDWFRPNVHPNVDLQAGAMNVLGGYDNETAKATANLIYMSSGKADTTIGGLDLSKVNMANQTFSSLSNGYGDNGDVVVQSFP
jgi:hypothetical protein